MNDQPPLQPSAPNVETKTHTKPVTNADFLGVKELEGETEKEFLLMPVIQERA
jgi:hypothetical protein